MQIQLTGKDKSYPFPILLLRGAHLLTEKRTPIFLSPGATCCWAAELSSGEGNEQGSMSSSFSFNSKECATKLPPFFLERKRASGIWNQIHFKSAVWWAVRGTMNFQEWCLVMGELWVKVMKGPSVNSMAIHPIHPGFLIHSQILALCIYLIPDSLVLICNCAA